MNLFLVVGAVVLAPVVWCVVDRFAWCMTMREMRRHAATWRGDE